MLCAHPTFAIVLFYKLPGHRTGAFLMKEVDHGVARAWAANGGFGNPGLSLCLDLLLILW